MSAVLEKQIALALRSVLGMLTALSVSFIYVLGRLLRWQARARDRGDADLGPFRWPTVQVASELEARARGR
jgi:hypothetical protein